MNPLKSITGTIVTGAVISAIVMAIFADGSGAPGAEEAAASL